MPVLCNWLPIH